MAPGRTNSGPQWRSPTVPPLVNGMTVSLSPSLSLGRMTWVEDYLISWLRCSQESGDQMVEVPSERVATSRKRRPKYPHGKSGELVKIFITTMPSSGESHWSKVESVVKGSTFTWSEWQKTVIIPRLPSSTPLVTRIAMGKNHLTHCFSAVSW